MFRLIDDGPRGPDVESRGRVEAEGGERVLEDRVSHDEGSGYVVRLRTDRPEEGFRGRDRFEAVWRPLTMEARDKASSFFTFPHFQAQAGLFILSVLTVLHTIANLLSSDATP